MRRLAPALLLLAMPACHQDDSAVLLVVLTASGSPPAVAALDVTLSGPAGTSSNRYARNAQEPIAFPTTLSARLPVYATGLLTIDVQAEDAAGANVASGHQGPFPIAAGQRETVYVRLDCGGAPCVAGGGTGGDGGGTPMATPRCGNGRVDPGETCDTAIAAGDPGACPPTCDDHIPCTRDMRSGSNCTVSCKHEEIRMPVLGDGCCPAGVAYPEDTDCSPTCGNGVVDPGETCDTAIARGAAGACPSASECAPGAACEISMLVSAGNCSAVCARYPIVTQSNKDPDTCCPAGATSAVDTDCPAACGNGVIDPSESCDVGIPPLKPGSCPTSCDDGEACTIDYFATVACQPSCQHFVIKTPVSGDGCCPQGANHSTDTDCPALCGNGVIEPGEACDGASCPTSCPALPSKCLRAEIVGDAEHCSARCVVSEVKTCDLQQRDGCCPTGCSATDDVDCSPRCGDGFISTTFGEKCDIAAPLGNPNHCPESCADNNPCTDDRLVSGGTCAAMCVFLPITAFRPGDGCCPLAAGANFALDPDCTPRCGNGIVETPAERCDFAAGCPGPDSCPSDVACTRYVVQGSDTSCTAMCVAMPITGCTGGDGCCPAGCSPANDGDCPVICGDGVVSDGESCDRAITAGTPGACPGTCDDGNACTLDLASGSPEGCTRACIHQPVTGCIADDGCCPAGCSAANDRDCDPHCPDGRIGAGETCDPPSSCPTSCPDDGDPCTAEQLTGASTTCNAACRHTPITACSGAKADSCCPTGCTLATDSDC